MVASARSYQCQQCGGNASPVSGRDYLQCDYCRCLVFTSENPLTVDRITPQESDLQAGCPVCAGSLQAGQIEGQPVLYCSGCYGLLLRNQAFGNVVRVRRAKRVSADAVPVTPLDPGQYDRRIHCPNCTGLMDVHPYYGPGNVVIDSCGRCQYVWLDHSELRNIEQAEGGAQPLPSPQYVTSAGDVTTVAAAPAQSAGLYREDSPLGIIADLIFGMS